MVANGSATPNNLTAVVADRMPLVRVGLAASLTLVGVTTIAYAGDLADGVEAAFQAEATLLVLGGASEATAEPLAREIGRLGMTRVMLLVANADRRVLALLLEAGAGAVALRTIRPEDFGELVLQVLDGHRSVDPALMSVVVDLTRDRPAPDPLRPRSVTPWRAPADRPDSATDGRDIPLTTKELQVLARLSYGDSNAEIAEALFVSPATVKTHLAHIYAKLGVGSRHSATSRAVALGLLPSL